MSGSSGPRVTLQMPSSPRVMSSGLGSPSNNSFTSFAPGSRRRNVTLPSGWTSGDVTAGRGDCWAKAQEVRRSRIRIVHFMAKGILHRVRCHPLVLISAKASRLEISELPHCKKTKAPRRNRHVLLPEIAYPAMGAQFLQDVRRQWTGIRSFDIGGHMANVAHARESRLRPLAPKGRNVTRE